MTLKWRVRPEGVYPTFLARAPPHERSFLSTFPARAGVLMIQRYTIGRGGRKQFLIKGGFMPTNRLLETADEYNRPASGGGFA